MPRAAASRACLKQSSGHHQAAREAHLTTLCSYLSQLLSQELELSLPGGSNAPWPGGYPLATNPCYLSLVSEVLGQDGFMWLPFPALPVHGVHMPESHEMWMVPQ